jgi:hypothetical protein
MKPVDRPALPAIPCGAMFASTSMHTRLRRFRLGAAVGVAFFALTQFAFLVHESRHLVHKPGEICQICVHASHAANAIPATVVVPIMARGTLANEQRLEQSFLVSFSRHFPIRAPPIVLS